MEDELAKKAKAGIREIAKLMPMEITSSVEDIDAKASQLVKELKVNLATTPIEAQGRKCSTIKASDVVAGTFEGVSNLLPRTVLCYDVVPVQNQSIFPPDPKVPKIYKARVKVSGDESVLNSGVAYFLVPPEYEKQ